MKEQRMTAKREIRRSLGLKNPDYRHKVYNVDEVLKKIVDLAVNERVGIVGNTLIYETVTGFSNYSRKRWEILKPILVIIASNIEYSVDGQDYIISTYSPMFVNKFNFYLGKPRNNPVAGFSVHRKYKIPL